MANPERGEVDLVVGDQTYTLKLTTNAACALEARTNRKTGDLLADTSALSVTAIRDLMFAFLQPIHAKDFKTVTQVGEFLDQAGGLSIFFDVIGRLAKASLPESDPNALRGQSEAGAISVSTPSVAD